MSRRKWNGTSLPKTERWGYIQIGHFLGLLSGFSKSFWGPVYCIVSYYSLGLIVIMYKIKGLFFLNKRFQLPRN